MKRGEGVKISLKAFLLSVLWVAVISCLCYFALMPLCEMFVPFLKPFVFLISTALFIVLFYLGSAHFKTFFAEIKGGELLIFKGFLIRRKIRLNLSYTVSVKLLSTPLMRLLGLSNLLLIFEGSVCLLPLLRKTDAHELFGEIIKIRDKNEKL